MNINKNNNLFLNSNFKLRGISFGNKNITTPISNSLDNDTFIKNKPTIKIKYIPLTAEGDVVSLYKENKEKANLRMKKYGSNEPLKKPKQVSKEEFEAMKLIQFELDEYTNVQKKLRSNMPLDEKEEIFYKKIINATQKTAENKTLWRCITPYQGLEYSINSGILKMDGFSSTSSTYNSFFDFWGTPKTISKDGEIVKTLPYFLKINVPQGTNTLDCNAIYDNQKTRMAEEVILLPGECKVINIDNETNVIEVDYTQNNNNISN